MKQRIPKLRSPAQQRGHAGARFVMSSLCASLHLALAAMNGLVLCGGAHANPMGGTVVSGQANIAQPSPSQMQITQSTDRAVIDWRSFSIGMGESVRFIQPSAMSATLNRVVGNEPSSILGTMSANGHVYLVNQNGVYIGRDAQVDVAGLVLSTANISNGNFMAGRMNFDQPGKPDARIVNEGRITVAQSGLAAMVAPGVQNRGVISARLGEVMLAGASTFSLDLHGDGLMNLVVSPGELAAIRDAGGTPLANYVDHSGRITAEGGRVWLSAATASGIVDGSVNISGGIDTSHLAGKGGEITAIGGDRLAVSGTLQSTGGIEGGRISASASNIALASTALLDASGGTQGGLVQVGGTFRGTSPVPGATSMASQLDVAPGARAKADATGPVGHGGTVVLWSNQDTRFHGVVSALAGVQGGDGGMMEVSGKKHLVFDGQADAHAPHGAAGTLLLDPGSLTVAENGGTSLTASGSDSTAGVASINASLRGGNNVVLAADDDIFINAVIDGRPFANVAGGLAGGSLFLEAGRSVEINKAVVLNGGGFFSNSVRGGFTQLESAPIISFAADGESLAQGGFSITATGDIRTQYLLTAGNVALSSSSGNITASRLLGGSAAGDQIDKLTATALNGSVNLVGVGARKAVNVDAGSIGALGNIYAGNLATIKARTGDLKLGSIQIDTGTVSIEASNGSVELPINNSISGKSASIFIFASGFGSGVKAEGTIAANDPAEAIGASLPGRIGLVADSDISVNQLVAFGDTSIGSSFGRIELKSALGGNDKDRPLLGSLALRAWKDITTNGLNLGGATSNDKEGLVIEAGTRLDISGAYSFNLAEGGRIAVNDRIGVSQGTLRFGAPIDSNPPLTEGFTATLSQGVYARNGNQDIKFNIPVAVNGSRIYADWKQVLGAAPTSAPTPVANPDAIVDMLMIPVVMRDRNDAELFQQVEDPQTGGYINTTDRLVNSYARDLVAAGGGYLVSVNVSDKKINSVCPPRGCPSSLGTKDDRTTDDYWMIPKIVISNQESPQHTDKGTISLRSVAQLVPTSASAAPTAALKIILPASEGERTILTNTGNNTLERAIADRILVNIFDPSCASTAGCRYFNGPNNNAPTNEALLPTGPDGLANLADGAFERSLNNVLRADLRPFTTEPGNLVSQGDIEAGIYRNGVVDVPGTTPTAAVDASPIALPVSLVFFWGPISSTASPHSADANTIVTTSGDLAFRSNSNPGIRFGNANPGSVSLSQQIAASLVPTQPTFTSTPTNLGINPDTGTGTSTGNMDAGDSNSRFNVAALRSLDEQADAGQATGDCVATMRQVIGRSSGDEADKGSTSALHGAPPPVFRTSYALGGVSDDLARSVDVRGISGTSSSDSCR